MDCFHSFKASSLAPTESEQFLVNQDLSAIICWTLAASWLNSCTWFLSFIRHANKLFKNTFFTVKFFIILEKLKLYEYYMCSSKGTSENIHQYILTSQQKQIQLSSTSVLINPAKVILNRLLYRFRNKCFSILEGSIVLRIFFKTYWTMFLDCRSLS